jgi:anaerobic selenocysteine-containing dehydrogenase
LLEVRPTLLVCVPRLWEKFYAGINARFAEARGVKKLLVERTLATGDRVRVFNQRGSVTLRAQVTDDMLPNIVILLHGWWASRIGGSSANALTPDSLADLGGGGTLHDTWVEVEKNV